ncbi:MAG: ribosome maturation factor RimP [Bacillota bacterium]
MDRQSIEKKVAELVSEIIYGTDFELVDIEYVKERDWYLRVLLDKPGGIMMDDCSFVSSKLNPLLDTVLDIPQQYFLEVSSPGLERPLKTLRDFERNFGKKVKIKFFAPIEGQKTLVGVLNSATDAGLELLIDENPMHIAMDKIASIKLHIEF